MTNTERHELSQGWDACPAWCVREHQDSDHPEDRVHRTQPIFVTAKTRDALLPEHLPRQSELLLMAATDGDRPWIVIDDDEGPLGVTMDLATANGLLAALTELLATFDP